MKAKTGFVVLLVILLAVATTAFAQTPTIEKIVLIDQNGVKITAKEIVNDSIWGKGIKLLIENDTDQNITVGCNSLVVNDYMVSNLFASTVAAGKKANDELTFYSSDLESAGITQIEEIEVSFNVYNSDTYDDIFDTDIVKIRTSAYTGAAQPPMDDGLLIFDREGIRIVAKALNNDSLFGTEIGMFIENHSNKDITVSCDDLSVNGYMVTSLFACTVNQGKMALDGISILSSDLEDNDISTIEDVELTLEIYDSNTYHTFLKSDPIEISFQP